MPKEMTKRPVKKSALDLALSHKEPGEIVKMNVDLTQEEWDKGFGEAVDSGLDADWNYYYAQQNSRDMYGTYITPDVRAEMEYDDATIQVDQTGFVVADAIELFPGAAVELTGAMTGKRETEGKTALKRLEGTGGTIVLAPEDTDNIVVVPILKFSVSEDRFEAEAKKQPGEGRDMPGFEQIKEIVFHGKEGMRLVAAQLLQIEDDKVILKEIKEYNYLTKSWCDTEDMTLSAGGFSRKENVADTPAGQAQQKQKLDEKAAGIEITPIQSKAAETTGVVADKLKELLEDDEFETTVGEEAGSKEDILTRIDMAKDAFLMYKDGMSHEEIEKILEERGLQEVKQKPDGLKFEADVFEAYYPLFPFLQLYVSCHFETELKHFFEKPSFAELGLDNPDGAHVIRAGAGVNAKAELGLSTGASVGVPLLMEVQGGLNGSLTLGGAGEKSTILAGTLILSMAAEKNEAGEIALKFAELPRLELAGNLKLSGQVGAGVSVKSKIFGWDKDLYEHEFGSWDILEFRGMLMLEKQDNSMKSPLSNWLTKSSSVNVSAFGKTLGERVRQSKFGENAQKAKTIADSTSKSKENYEVLLERLSAFKQDREQNPMIISKGAEGFQAMAKQAQTLQEDFRAASEDAVARLNDAIWSVEMYRGTNEYINGRKINMAGIAKHKQRLEAAQNSRTDAERAKLESFGYERYLEEQAEMTVLFQDAKAWKFYQNKFEEASNRMVGKKRILNVLKEKYDANKKKNPDYGKTRDAEFTKFYLKQLGSKTEAVRAYATPKDMQYYEQERRDKIGRVLDLSLNPAKPEEIRKQYEKQAKRLTLEGDLRWMILGNNKKSMDRVMNAEQKIRDQFVQNQQKTRDATRHVTGAKLLEEDEFFQKRKTEDRILALSSSHMQMLMERYFEKTAAGNLEIAWQQLVEEQLRQNTLGADMTLTKMMSRLFSVDMLLSYERERERKTADDAEKKKKHQFRIQRLENRKKIMMSERSLALTEEERAKLEQSAVMEYFDGYALRKGLQDTSDGLKDAVLRGKFAALFPDGQQKEFEQNMLREYRQLFSDSKMPEGGWEVHNENPILSAADRVEFLKNLSGEELSRLGEALRQMISEGALKADSFEWQDIGRFQNGKILQEDTDESMKRYELLCQAYDESADAVEFLTRYKEIYPMQHVRDELLKSYPFKDLPPEDAKYLHELDEEWEKHNKRVMMFPSYFQLMDLEKSDDYQEQRLKYVDSYLADLSSESNNFISKFCDSIMPFRDDVTPDAIMQYEDLGRKSEEKHYQQVFALLRPAMDGGVLNTGLEREQKENIYQKLKETDIEFFNKNKKQTASVMQKWKEASGAENMYSAVRIGDYEQGRIDFYKREMDKLNEPVQEIQNAVTELTKMIADATSRIMELEGMIQSPEDFLKKQGLPKENPLVYVGELSEAMWNDPKPPVKTEELLRKIQMA